MNELSLQIITTDAGFKALETEWTALHEEARGTIFQSFRWLSGWWDLYRRPNLDLRIAAVRDGGALVGLLPAFIDVSHVGPIAFRRMRLLGTFEIYGEYAPFFRPGREWDVLPLLAQFCADELAGGSCDAISLFRFNSSSPAMGILLQEIATRRFRVRHEPHAVARVMMRLPGDAESYLAGLSGAEREILRRRSRSLEKAGAEFETVSVPADADFDDFVRLHTSAWSPRGVVGYFRSERFEAFHRRATAEFMRERRAKLYFLRKDGVRFAAVQTYFMHDTCCFYLSGLDRSHELVRYSPGKVLLSYVIRDAIAQGCTMFDFQGGTEEYKYRLGGKEASFAKAVIWEKGLPSLKVVPLLGCIALYNALVGGIWAYQILPRARALGERIGVRRSGQALHPRPQEQTP